MFFVRQKYTQVKDNEDDKDFAQEDGTSSYSDLERISLSRREYNWTRIHLAIITTYSAIFLVAMLRLGNSANSQVSYSPAEVAAKYERKTFHGSMGDINVYRGASRPELESAWHQLIEHTNVRVSADDLRKINRMSIQLQDGSGDYLASIDVFHQLHCLKYVRDVIEFGTNETSRLPEHLDHCLDSIRQLIMCKADVSLMTFDWAEGWRKPWPNFEVAHDCRNFEAIDEWAAEHHVDMFAEGMITHPQLGVPFPVDENGHMDESGKVPGMTRGKIITPPLEWPHGIRVPIPKIEDNMRN